MARTAASTGVTWIPATRTRVEQHRDGGVEPDLRDAMTLVKSLVLFVGDATREEQVFKKSYSLTVRVVSISHVGQI
jgi:hypothetical protein